MPPEFDPSADRGDSFTPSAEALAAAASAPAADNAAILAAAKDDSGTPAAKDDAHADDGDAGAAAAAATEAAARDDKGRFGIPKARFDEAVNKERERAATAERQLAELQKQLQAVDRSTTTAQLEAQLVELRKADRKAMMDGDEEKSVQLATQIDRINRQIIIAESQSMSQQAGEEARESIRVETAIERLEDIYPVLKEGSETFDQGLVDLVLAAQTQLINRDRMAPSQALTKAANDIMSRFQPARKADEPAPGGLAGAKGADRTQAAKAKAIDAALKTPPDTRDVGLDTDKAGMRDGMPAPTNIDDLKAIPEATLKRMRGDMA